MALPVSLPSMCWCLHQIDSSGFTFMMIFLFKLVHVWNYLLASFFFWKIQNLEFRVFTLNDQRDEEQIEDEVEYNKSSVFWVFKGRALSMLLAIENDMNS